MGIDFSSYLTFSSTDEIHRSLFVEEDALLDSDANETNRQIIKDVINDVIELTVRKSAHNEDVEKLFQEMFLKAKADMMQEVYKIQEISVQRTDEKLDNLEVRVSQMNKENNAFREDIFELKKEVGKVSAVSDDALSKAAENKAAIGRINEILETLQLKASVYERNQEDLEEIKMDVASLKRKYQEDHHNSLRQTRPRGLSLGDSSNKPSVVTNLARKIGVVYNKEAEVDDSLCPVCGKRFKNSKGVLRHRSAKNSSCKPEKNPLRSSDKKNEDTPPASHIAK